MPIFVIQNHLFFSVDLSAHSHRMFTLGVVVFFFEFAIEFTIIYFSGDPFSVYKIINYDLRYTFVIFRFDIFFISVKLLINQP